MRPYEYTDYIHTVVSFEFDLDHWRIDRETYNLLDWLGDLGGLREALIIILGAMYSFFNFRNFQDYLVSKLFRPASSRVQHSMYDEDFGMSTGERSMILDPKRMNCFMKRLYEL